MNSPQDINSDSNGASSSERERVFLVSSPMDLSPTIDLKYWLSAFWSGKWRLLALAILCGVLAFGLSYLFAPVYSSTTVISPVSEDSNRGLAAIAGQLSGVGLSGLNFSPSDSRRAEAIAVLRSRVLVEQLILEEDLLPILFAGKWDSEAGDWVVDADDIPSLQDAFIKFDEDVRRVDEDVSTGLVTVTVRWTDPAVAADWVGKLVDRADARLRETAIEEARSSIAFLESELATTTVVGIQQVIIRLIESQINNITLANSRQNYAFRIIDPGTVADTRYYVSPDRALFLKLGLLLGMVLGFAWVMASTPLQRTED